MKKLGKFEIIEKVGQGAMGVVYKARDPMIDRIVALKTLTTALADDPNLLKRFYSEARSAGGLQHPNIVTIYELGHEGSTPFIAMQFLNGESLDKVVARRSNLLLSQIVGFIVYVCRGLDYAHKQRPPVIHRDIKPGNVMVTTEGTVIVVDFGIARLGEGTRSQSAGLLIGTLGYMSPQMFRNMPADARSDIWATGVMFYELLAQRRPFDGENAAALMTNIVLEEPRPLSEAAPGTPREVEIIIEKMLEKELDGRYQTMEEVLMDLEPLWRRLQQEEVAKLLEHGRKIYEAGDLENARAKISQIMQIDTANTQAKSLLAKINAELRRKQIIPQVKSRIEKAEQLLADGRAEDAKAEIQAALKLDSTFQPAHELLGRADAAIDRARNIAQALRISKQRLVEGALTEAELELDKVLELEPGNAAAREQLKQIQEERSRRERRKKREEVLHRARTLWTNLQYDECISLLLEASKEFPGDPAITKLLESTRQDQAEQQRQSRLTEVRNLLNAQRFDEALQAAEALKKQYPADSTVENLRAHIVQAREQKIREQQLAEGKSKLRAWVQEGKFEEALRFAAKFAQEFPDDFELAGLIDFARAEQSQIEQKRRLEQVTKQVQKTLKEGHFSDAVVIAEKALIEFPKNIDLVILLDRARKEKDEKEKHELLKQRLREVERLLGRQDLTDAIDLARQTLATVGHDRRLSDALRKAEKEFEFRERKKRQQTETMQEAQAALKAGKFAEATSILNGAIATQLLTSNDSRVTELLSAISARERPAPLSPDPAVMAEAQASVLGTPITDTPSVDPGKTYVYQKGAPLPGSPDREALTSAFSPTIVTGPASRATAPPASTVVPESVTEVSQTQLSSPSTSAEPSGLFVGGAAIADQSRPESQFSTPLAPAGVHSVTEPRPLWKSPIAIGAAAVMVVSAASYALFRSHSNSGDSISLPEWDQAAQLMAMSPRHLADALAQYQLIVSAGRDKNGAAKQKISDIQLDQQRENDWMEKAAAAETAEQYQEALKDFTEAKAINGDREKEAEGAIRVVTDLLSGKNPIEVARENLARADQLAVERQWEQAVLAYKQVGNTKGLPPDLRASLSTGLKNASAHLDEETLWKRAVQSQQNGDLPTARALAERVAKLNLDHHDDARQLMRQLDVQLKSAGDDGEYADLRRQVDAARQSPNETTLKSLLVRAQAIAGANGKHAVDAQRIATSEIPQLLDALSKASLASKIQNDTQRARSLLQGGESARFTDAMKFANDIGQLGGDPNNLSQEIFAAESHALQELQNEFNGANKKSEPDLLALQSKARQFKANANKPQDVDALLSSIDTAIVSARTPNPPPPPAAGSGNVSPSGGSPSGPISPTSDQEKIAQLLDSFAQAYEAKDLVQLRHLWPTLTDKEFKNNIDAFKGADSIHMTMHPNSMYVSGSSATATCLQTIEVRSQGKVQRLTSTAIFTLRKIGIGSGDWIVERVSFEKNR